MPTIPKPKFPRAAALAVAREMVKYLKPYCLRLICAGSLRRRKDPVGDVEILFLPKRGPLRDGLFDIKQIDLTYISFDHMLRKEVIAMRKNSRGFQAWGEKNKLALHLASGIPVDFFRADEETWWNSLVCRTGSAESNCRIAMAAQAKGWKWNPYGVGFTNDCGQTVPVTSERDVFALAGLPYLEPWER